MLIRAAQPSDTVNITDIYNHYIRNTVITFEEDVVSVNDMNKRLLNAKSLDLPWLVAEENNGKILGYAYASPWRERSAYRFTIEVTVYLSDLAIHRGIGSKLYDALFSELRKIPVHVVIGVIALPNEASVALHEKFGMSKTAHFKEVGYKFDQWIDVGYWQLNMPD